MASRAVQAGRAFIELFLDGSKIQGQLREVGASVQATGQRIAGVGAGIAGFGAAIGAPLVAAAANVANMGAELTKVSVQTGATVEELARLQAAASKLRIDPDDLVGGIEELNIRLGEAVQDGTGPLVEAFRKLNLDPDDIVALTVEERIKAIGDAIAGVENQADRGFLADEIFGGDAFRLLPLLRQGSEGIDELANSAARLGNVLTGEQAADAAAFTDAWQTFRATISGVTTQIGAALLPSLTTLFQIVQPIALGIADFVRENAQIAVVVGGAAAALVAAGTALVGLGGAISLAGVALSGLAAVFGAIASPIGIAVAAVVGLTTAFVVFTDTGRGALASLSENFGSLFAVVSDTLGLIGQALAAGEIQAAVDLLWAGIRLAWQEGTAGIVEVARGWQSFLLDIVNNVANGILTAWQYVTKTMQDLFAAVGNFVLGVFIRIRGFFDETYDSAAALENLAATAEQARQQREANFEQNLANIAAGRADRTEEIYQANRAASDAARAELEATRREFEAARAQAEQAVANAPEREFAKFEEEVGKRTQALELAGAETTGALSPSQRSTFRGDVAERLFGTSARVEQQQLDEQKRTNEILEQIASSPATALAFG